MLVETDLGEGWIKLPSNPEGPHALAAELIGTRLAEWLGLATFDVCTLHCPALELPGGNGYSTPGLAFTARKIPGQTWGEADEQLEAVENRADFAGLVALDTWIRNPDRYCVRAGETRANLRNVFFGHDDVADDKVKLIAMDFSDSIRCGDAEITRRSCAIDQQRQALLFGLFPQFRRYVTEDLLRELADKLGSFPRDEARTIVDAVPGAWELPPDLRDRLVDFLRGRAVFLAEHLLQLWRDEIARQRGEEAAQAQGAEQPGGNDRTGGD